MPPKQAKVPKDKQKVVEDKTFGLKNKNKSSKVQQHIREVKQAATQSQQQKNKAAADQKQALADKKAKELKAKEELADLFKPVQVQQKVPFGTDPKTLLCAFYKAGTCTKGTKCKFSHDLDIERKVRFTDHDLAYADCKGAKRDLYTDVRDEKNEDTIDKWDQSKLETVVKSKHGNPQTTTDIVCKFFLDAIEDGKYGWFWECPNGGDKCKYRHALPPGYVLKSKKKKSEEDKKDVLSIEDFLETERHKLGTNLTPVTYETFMKWKTERKLKKDAEDEALRKSKETAFKAGKANNMSGKDLFEFNPDWQEDADDDEGGFDMAKWRKDGEKEHEEDNEMEFQARQNGTAAPVQEHLFAQEDFEDSDEEGSAAASASASASAST